MPKKFNLIAAGAFALLAADNLRIKFRAKKATEEFTDAHTVLAEAYAVSLVQNEYLSNLLDRYRLTPYEINPTALNFN